MLWVSNELVNSKLPTPGVELTDDFSRVVFKMKNARFALTKQDLVLSCMYKACGNFHIVQIHEMEFVSEAKFLVTFKHKVKSARNERS